MSKPKKAIIAATIPYSPSDTNNYRRYSPKSLRKGIAYINKKFAKMINRHE